MRAQIEMHNDQIPPLQEIPEEIGMLGLNEVSDYTHYAFLCAPQKTQKFTKWLLQDLEVDIEDIFAPHIIDETRVGRTRTKTKKKCYFIFNGMVWLSPDIYWKLYDMPDHHLQSFKAKPFIYNYRIPEFYPQELKRIKIDDQKAPYDNGIKVGSKVQYRDMNSPFYDFGSMTVLAIKKGRAKLNGWAKIDVPLRLLELA